MDTVLETHGLDTPAMLEGALRGYLAWLPMPKLQALAAPPPKLLLSPLQGPVRGPHHQLSEAERSPRPRSVLGKQGEGEESNLLCPHFP